MNRINDFIFAEVDARIYSLLRIIFGFIALLLMLDFWPLLDLHYSMSAWLPKSMAVLVNESLGWSPLFFIKSHFAVVTYYLLGMFFIFSFMVGFKTRFTGFAAYLFMASFRDRNSFLFDGDDEYIRMVFLLLIMAPSGLIWSIDSWKKTFLDRKTSGWPLRLLQFQLLSVYFFNSIAKIQGSGWTDGTAIISAVINPAYGRFDFVHQNMPHALVLALMFLGTMVPYMQIAIAIFLCVPKWRKIAFLLGISLHLGIEVFIKLRFFPWIMISWYLVFVDENFISTIEFWFVKKFKQLFS